MDERYQSELPDLPHLKEPWGQRVVIDGLAWIPLHLLRKQALEGIKEDLTITVKVREGARLSHIQVPMYTVSDFWIGLPRAYYETRAAGRLPVEYNVTRATSERIKTCKVEPRDPLQQDAVAKVLDALESKDVTQAILCAATGVGKTILSLVIASKLGLKTLIVAPLTNLIDQWQTRISVTVDDDNPTAPSVLPLAKVGRFIGDQRQYGEDYDVVLATVQTLSRCDPNDPIFSWPGLLIVDEVHFMGSAQWSAVNYRFRSQKRLGLTATPRRSDGAERLFFEHLGKIVWRGAKPMMSLSVRRIETSRSYPASVKDPTRLAEYLVKDRERSLIVAREICHALQAGRRPIVLSNRIDQLVVIKAAVEHTMRDQCTYGVCCGSWPVDTLDAARYILDKDNWRKPYKRGRSWILKSEEEEGLSVEKHEIVLSEDGVVTGAKPLYRKIKKAEFEASKSASVIFATYSMVAVGFDVPALDTLMVAMPRADMEQAVGRILRKAPDKKPPIVVHFVDDHLMSRIMWSKASKQYDLLGDLEIGEDE